MTGNPEACPKCGGKNGVHTRETVGYTACYEWAGSHIESQVGSQVSGGKAYYCCDCGRNVTKYMKVIRHD